MNDKEKLIRELMKEKGGTREQYLSVLDAIAYHESGHTMDPTIKQIGGGPGRGKYQFEEGKNEGAITAAKRTKRYYEKKGFPVPKWLQEASQGDSLDATKLSSEQQDVLFLGNMRMHPAADLGKVVNGEESIEDFWANYHWAGAKEDRPERISSFKKSLQHYADARPNSKVREFTQPKKEIVDPRMEAVAVRDNIPADPRAQPNLTQHLLPQQPQQEAVAQAEAPKPLLDTSMYGNLMEYVKAASDKNKLTAYNQGGTHEQNPMGGVQIGTGANGLPNRVEEGETSYNLGGNKFVFSNRINVNDKMNGTQLEKPKFNNTFALGGYTSKCGGPGQPPCKDDTDLSKVQILDEVKLTHKKKDSRFVKEDDPRYQSYNDSLSLYKKGLNDLKGGKGYEHLSYYKGKPRSQYPFALSSDNSNDNRERLLSKKEISNEISEYGKRDYDYVMSGKAKARYEASKNGDMYDDGEYLHKYQLPYSEVSEIRNHYNEMPKLHPDEQRIKPTSIVFGPESDPVALYDKPKGKFFVEGSPEAEIARRQLILKQRGTYNGPIDGIWGKESEEALANTDFKSKEGKPIYQDIKFGKYKDYFEVQGMHSTDPETTIIRMTDKNPHNAHTVKQLESYLKEQNPNKKFKIVGKSNVSTGTVLDLLPQRKSNKKK